ncbi:TetR family transcriptional regulator [Bacillus megaterium]|nr:TetR family transcriptional regulator [Priestia megaterium]
MVSIIETNLYSIPAEQKKSVIVDADWNDKYGHLVILKTGNKYQIVINNYTIDPPLKITTPLIRWINEQEFLIVNSRTRSKNSNLYILNREGAVKSSFYCGDAIEDVSPNKEGIWISYFDEGVFGKGISTEGLVLFSYGGQPIFRFHSDLDRELVIGDCYAICKSKANALWLCAFPDFDIVELDKNKKVSGLYTIPSGMEGSKAINIRNRVAYFYSPHNNRYELYRCELGNGNAVKVGFLEAHTVRGLGPREHNHFVSISDSSLKGIRIEEESAYN